MSIESDLWYLIAGNGGGTNRVRVIRLLEDRPRNANQLADKLDLSYNTVRYHLDLLRDHDIVESDSHEYGKLYYLTDRFERHRDEFETITERVE